jgi:acetolactate synthase-1/2/3 large subunit
MIAYSAQSSRIGSELLPALRTALTAATVSVIACPVDDSANLELIESLADLAESLS